MDVCAYVGMYVCVYACVCVLVYGCVYYMCNNNHTGVHIAQVGSYPGTTRADGTPNKTHTQNITIRWSCRVRLTPQHVTKNDYTIPETN